MGSYILFSRLKLTVTFICTLDQFIRRLKCSSKFIVCEQSLQRLEN